MPNTVPARQDAQRSYRQIADRISSMIRDGHFAPGTRLPSERDLSVLLKVSRPSVREALIALEVGGVVDVRLGSGIYVREGLNAARERGGPDEPGPFEIMRARWLIEGEIAAIAAISASTESIERIAATLEQMQREIEEDGLGYEGDRAFHLSVAEATGNSALVFVVRSLWDHRRGVMYRKIEEHFDSPMLRADAVREHRAVLAAIEARDARKAKSAMRHHLSRSQKEFARDWKHVEDRDKKDWVMRVQKLLSDQAAL
jgi:DNA-binding FadR family transcriptional regulator